MTINPGTVLQHRRRSLSPPHAGAKSRQTETDPMNVHFVDNLREAAREYGAVADLLSIIRDAIVIDDLGNRELNVDEEDCKLLRDAQIAAEFACYDRSGDEAK